MNYDSKYTINIIREKMHRRSNKIKKLLHKTYLFYIVGEQIITEQKYMREFFEIIFLKHLLEKSARLYY